MRPRLLERGCGSLQIAAVDDASDEEARHSVAGLVGRNRSVQDTVVTDAQPVPESLPPAA